jgi:hypothetical protein
MAQGFMRRAGKAVAVALLFLGLNVFIIPTFPTAAQAKSSAFTQTPGTSGGWDSKPEDWSSPVRFPVVGPIALPISVWARQTLGMELVLLITFRWL